MEKVSKEDTRRPRCLVLCFDGTGDKFGGTPADSNVIKIFSMLDHEDPNQFSYYQPGIGTYVESRSIRRASGYYTRVKSWYTKMKDQMVGTSFGEHVVAGYKFLMRYYNNGDKVYFFGFSRGAYTARFLAEMIDYIGLLQPGNEEMVRFAWKTFARWQMRRTNDDEEKEKNAETFRYMKKFRETFSRPVSRITFLGLFDTVNSVPLFEVSFMERSRFPYTAKTSARVIRHAVAIDERRCKFRQDLISETKPGKPENVKTSTSNNAARSLTTSRTNTTAAGRFRPHMRHSQQARKDKSAHVVQGLEHTAEDERHKQASVQNLITKTSDEEEDRDEDEDEQDIEEIWFAGSHADIGGGWPIMPNEGQNPLSHVALMWMIREARKAGVPFDDDKLREANYFPYEPLPIQSPVDVSKSGGHSEATAALHPDAGNYHKAVIEAETSRTHDCLRLGHGLAVSGVATWLFMEHFPFRRMDLQHDGSWRPIRWPLPRGETRDMPMDAVVHGSVIRRMELDPKYRPGNLVIGGGGRVPRVAPAKHGTGIWKTVRGKGDLLGECYVRAPSTPVAK